MVNLSRISLVPPSLPMTQSTSPLLHLDHVHRARGNAQAPRILGDQVEAGEATWYRSDVEIGEPSQKSGKKMEIPGKCAGHFNFEAICF